jgi:hypothetical protein
LGPTQRGTLYSRRLKGLGGQIGENVQHTKVRQAGQSAVLFLGFLASVLGALLVVFNVGQTTNAKMRAMNAADAAAYSGALWEARALNLQAYLNRAMVANEVAIAQSVSLRSWIDYLKRFVGNINLVGQFVPYLGVATRALANGLSQADRTVQQLLPLSETALRLLNTATSTAQSAINFQGAPVAADLARSVATSNGATISPGGIALMARNAAKWTHFTQDYSKSSGVVGTDGRTRLRAVALDSRDGFSQARDFTLGGKPVAQLRKQGGTDLLGFDSWKGLDSSQFDMVFNYLKGDWATKVPIGWGGAQAYTTKASGYGHHGNVNDWGSIDGKLAVAASDKSPNAAKIKGPGAASQFPNYRDLAKMDQRPAPQRVADVHLQFAVEVVIDKAAVNTSETALQHANTVLNDGTVVDHHSNFASGDKGVFALSEACVRFSRPYGATRTGGLEYPSLFNPYWRASLATISKASRALADLNKGLPESALLEGTGTCA